MYLIKHVNSIKVLAFAGNTNTFTMDLAMAKTFPDYESAASECFQDEVPISEEEYRKIYNRVYLGR